jgi:hypothetical protein
VITRGWAAELLPACGHRRHAGKTKQRAGAGGDVGQLELIGGVAGRALTGDP